MKTKTSSRALPLRHVALLAMLLHPWAAMAGGAAAETAASKAPQPPPAPAALHAPAPPNSRTAGTLAVAASNPARLQSKPEQVSVPTVAIDTGRMPASGHSGTAFAYNRRFADSLSRALLARGVAVKRIPAALSPAERASAAAGATLLVSVNHESPSTQALKQQAAAHSGYAVAVSRQQGASLPMALNCSRQVAAALSSTGRGHSLLHAVSGRSAAAGKHPWVDEALGVQAQDDLPVLKLAPVPALRLQAAVLSNPAEGKRAQDPTWTRLQAQAVARGLAACLGRAGVVEHKQP